MLRRRRIDNHRAWQGGEAGALPGVGDWFRSKHCWTSGMLALKLDTTSHLFTTRAPAAPRALHSTRARWPWLATAVGARERTYHLQYDAHTHALDIPCCSRCAWEHFPHTVVVLLPFGMRAVASSMPCWNSYHPACVVSAICACGGGRGLSAIGQQDSTRTIAMCGRCPRAL